METPALNSSAFWESSETHIALARGVEEPLGLRDFVRSTLGEAGWCLFQTSGTTGEQKWAVLKRSAFLISSLRDLISSRIRVVHPTIKPAKSIIPP